MYKKLFETVEVFIPYNTGIDKYSGLFDLFEKEKKIIKEGNRYVYVDKEGTEHKYWRKDYLANHNKILDLIMQETEAVN